MNICEHSFIKTVFRDSGSKPYFDSFHGTEVPFRKRGITLVSASAENLKQFIYFCKAFPVCRFFSFKNDSQC